MKGLIKKDIRSLLANKIILLLYGGMIIYYMFSMKGMTGVVAGVTMGAFFISALLTQTLVNDEMDNGMQFILTFPISRREYVKAKYILTGVGTVFCNILLIIAAYIIGTIQDQAYSFKTILLITGVATLGSILYTVIIIPLNLKCGSQKAAFIQVGVIFGLGAIAFIIGNLFDINMGEVVEFVSKVKDVPTSVLVIIGVAIVSFAIYITYVISYRVLEKKEF